MDLSLIFVAAHVRVKQNKKQKYRCVSTVCTGCGHVAGSCHPKICILCAKCPCKVSLTTLVLTEISLVIPFLTIQHSTWFSWLYTTDMFWKMGEIEDPSAVRGLKLKLKLSELII